MALESKVWYMSVKGITYLAGVALIVGAVLLAVAALLGLSSYLANGPNDLAAIIVLIFAGFFLLWLGT